MPQHHKLIRILTDIKADNRQGIQYSYFIEMFLFFCFASIDVIIISNSYYFLIINIRGMFENIREMLITLFLGYERGFL